MAEAVLVVMFVAAVLYTVLAGADFGAGLIEAFVDRKGRDRIEVALSPVWETNHVWLVLLVVLAFVAFPAAYAAVSTYLHVPLLCVLLGVVARGCAFTFRHYDPAAGSLDRVYTTLFRLSSFFTPLFLGVIVAATAGGKITQRPGAGFYEAFVAPWNTLLCWLTGLFVCALFAFEGASLLAAENGKRGEPLPYLQLARITHACAIVSGAFVFAVAWYEEAPWFEGMRSRPFAIACLACATLLIPAVARAFRTGHPWLLRGAMSAQVAAVLAGFWAAQYPVLVRMQPHDLTVHDGVAPDATLRTLLIAVAVGLSLILPGIAYLIRVYKT